MRIERLVIDLFKSAVDDLIAGRGINRDSAVDTLRTASIALDRREVYKYMSEDISSLRDDILWLLERCEDDEQETRV